MNDEKKKERKPGTINIFTVMIENTGKVYKISKHKLWKFMKSLDLLKYRYEIYFNSIDRKFDLLLSNDDLGREYENKKWIVVPDEVVKEIGMFSLVCGVNIKGKNYIVNME